MITNKEKRFLRRSLINEYLQDNRFSRLSLITLKRYIRSQEVVLYGCQLALA